MKMTNGVLEVSASLKGGRFNNEGREWLQDNYRLQSLLSAATRIIHPEMYQLGRECMLRLQDWARKTDDREMVEVLKIWPSIFGSLSIMVNRSSPFHLDRNGRVEFFDQLLTVGEYRNLDIVFPTLKVRCKYLPGTVLAFSGKQLEHGVGEVAEDRACVAWYMQQKVHAAMEI